MNKFLFYLITTILMLIISVALAITLLTGNGTAMYIKNYAASEKNSGNVADLELPVPTAKAKLPYDPYSVRGLTEDTLNHIYIDGVRYDFPLHLNELPEELNWYYAGVHKNEEKGLYNYGVMLQYNGIPWAIGNYEHETDNYFADSNDVAVTTLTFMLAEPNKHLPEILVGGFDIFNADFKQINKALGNDAAEYGYNTFYAPADNENASIILSLFSDPLNIITRIQYAEEAPEKAMEHFEFYDEDPVIQLPDDYSIEADEINNSFEYISLPENDDEMRAALENVRIGDVKVTLPCTVNALMDTFNAKTSSAYYWETFDEFNKLSILGKFKYNNEDVGFIAIFEHGQTLGDAQVIYINSDILTLDNISVEYDEIIDERSGKLVYDDIYTFTESEGNSSLYYDSYHHYLTDYEYNNFYCRITVDIDEGSISYWPENLTLRE